MASNRLLRSSWLWLVIAAILSLFSGGRWAIPLAAWLAPVFLLRFARARRPLSGYLVVALVRAAAGMVTLQGVIPAPGVVFYPLILFLSLVTTLPYLADRLIAPRLQSFSHGFAGTLVFPAAYTTVEYISSIGPFGAFSSTANTQYGNLPLMQLASLTGIWGITFLIIWFASVVNWAWEQADRRGPVAWPQVRGGILLYVAILSAVMIGGGARLALFPPQATRVRVAGISASQAPLAVADQQIFSTNKLMTLLTGKATPAEQASARSVFAPITEDLFARTQQEARAGAKIVVWPESGTTVLQADVPALIQRASALSRQEGIYLELGLGIIPAQAASGPTAKDETIFIDPAGKVLWTYEKTHLVPFGETGLIIPGNGNVPMVDTPYGRLASVICFDLDFPGMIRQAGQAGAALMLAPSNDWQAIDPMHTQAAAFRAIENGFTLVRQTSHGLAMVADYEGHVLAASDFYTTDQQVMIAYVPIRGVSTLYAAFGDWFAWLSMLCLVTLAGLAILLGRTRPLVATVPVPLTGSNQTDDSPRG